MIGHRAKCYDATALSGRQSEFACRTVHPASIQQLEGLVVRICRLSCAKRHSSKPIHLASGRIVGRVVATNAVPDTIVSPELEEKLAKEDGEKPTCL